MGRVVITHSTYIEGLIPLLKLLAQVPGIDTVTPAVICRVKTLVDLLITWLEVICPYKVSEGAMSLAKGWTSDA
jgi:hypothetical protein